MNQELREHLGKVAFNATANRYEEKTGDYYPSWETAGEGVQEECRLEAEAVASEFAGMLTAPIQQMFQAFLTIMNRVNEHDANT